MKHFILGFTLATLIFASALMIQRHFWEVERLELIHSLSEENYRDKQEVRKMWKEATWLRKQIGRGK